MVTAIISILMFLVMVSLHEFGHFIVAKLLNFKVDEFAVGMGPAILKKQKGETLYSLRAIPFGGYCKFEGEDEGDNPDPRAFANQKAWKRLLVLIAGGIFNIILGFMLFVAIVPMTSPVATNVVDTVVEHSYIEQSGIMPGDEIIEINGKRINFFSDIQLYLQNVGKDEDVNIRVRRNKEKLDYTIKLSEQYVENTFTENGIQITNTINGYSTGDFIEYGEEYPKNDARVGTTVNDTRHIIGFVAKQEDINIFNVWGFAWDNTRFVVKLVYQSFWDMVTGKVGVEEMSGPVGIVTAVNTAAKSEYGLMNVLNLIALVTINLGIFNLLPLPALDGGRILFVLIEFVRGKPIPPEKEGIVHAIGMIALLAFALFISYHDILKLFR